MKRLVRTRLEDMLDAIDGVSGVLDGASLHVYEASWEKRRATERGIEIVSEASRHIPADMKASAPHIPWPEIAAIGNILRHEYRRVEDRIIYETARRHLPELRKVVIAMMAEPSCR